MDIIRDENPLPPEVQNSPYTKKNFLSEVYMNEEKYDRLAGVLCNKMNVILQGAPVWASLLLPNGWHIC